VPALALVTLLTAHPAAQPAQPVSARTRALLEQVRKLSPAARLQVIAQMETAVAQASPQSRPALEDLLRQVKAIAQTDAQTNPAPSAPDFRTSLEHFQKLKPEQQTQVLNAMEAEAAKAPASTRAGYLTLLIQLRAWAKPMAATTRSEQNRIRTSIASYRRLSGEDRAKVLAQLQADASKAEPHLRKTLEAVISRLKAIPEN